MNQKELMFMLVLAVSAGVVSTVMNMVINMVAENTEVTKDGQTMKTLKTTNESKLENVDMLKRPLAVASFDNVYWMSNSLLMVVYVCLGYVVATQLQKAKLF
jgi:hypothetical protein